MDLSSLNEKQKEAVLLNNGPVMILAGAGSGKTKTLVTKVSYLLDDKNVSPYQILALTFSNKAAKEMRDRVSRETSIDTGALQITTFHAFCARILRSEANYLGLSKNFSIYDTSEMKSVVKAIYGRHGINQREVSPFELMNVIDDLKNNGHFPERVDPDFEPDTDDDFYQMYLEYENELFKANSVDFGGLITGVIQLFEKFPEVLERYQRRYKYLLIDEYQDTNRAQFQLMLMLSKKCENLCVVGDEDQSIYSWRGADIRNILDFESTFPDSKILRLEQNYRSSKNIIEAAGHVIARNELRKGKTMWTNNSHGDEIEIIECKNDKEESNYIADEILKLKNDGESLREVAVFYRTNSQSRLIEDSLRRLNIPYRVIGGVKFYERKEIKDLLAYLRIIINPRDSLGLSRIINVPARGIGATTLRKLEEEAIKAGISLWESVERVVQNPEDYSHIRLSKKVKSSLGVLSGLINEARVMEENKISPATIYEKILNESGYWDFLSSQKDYESQARLENLQELSSAIKQYENSNKEGGVTGFLESVTLDNTNSEFEDEQSGEVSLMTIHGAKGLEFFHVFIAGAEENVFPSFRSLEEGGNAEEEERRLFYVAMTRAMKSLRIVFARSRMLFGQLKFNGPSRFIHEIPNKYYTWVKKVFDEDDDFSQTPNSWDDDFSQESFYDDEKVIIREKIIDMPKAKFPAGSKIIHALYGEGKVLESEGIGADEKVVIRFNGGTRKKFMVKFAPLTII